MPFDAAVDVRSSVLETIKLVPVPNEVMLAHKREVEALWEEYARGKILRPVVWQNESVRYLQPADWNETRTLDFSRLRSWLRSGVGSDILFHGAGDIPEPVVNLANEVHGRLLDQGVEHDIRLEVFHTDPILNLMYRETDKTGWKKVCLAIWDVDDRGKATICNLAKTA